MAVADLVLEGGGVKGAGLAGAVSVLARNYQFHRVAGTSAGAIVAAFIAAGLGSELESMMVSTDFSQFLDEGDVLGHLGRVGQGAEVLFHDGVYKGEALHAWIASALASAGVHTWGDLKIDGATSTTPIEQRYKLVVVVSDISRGRMLRLPWDFPQLLGQDPDTMPVADAVRASASIPFFFRPWHLPVNPDVADGHSKLVLTDGGMLSNFPIGLFDSDTDHPTFGVKLSARLSVAQEPWHSSDDPLSLGMALIATMTNAHDQLYVDQASVTSRTVFVDASGVSSTDFTLTSATKQALFAKGAAAATQFLTTWNFPAWKQQYAAAPPSPA
ncbi:MAG: patatin-like phospholipase family protein [Jatrophihabitantaceae bacterium]